MPGNDGDNTVEWTSWRLRSYIEEAFEPYGLQYQVAMRFVEEPGFVTEAGLPIYFGDYRADTPYVLGYLNGLIDTAWAEETPKWDAFQYTMIVEKVIRSVLQSDRVEEVVSLWTRRRSDPEFARGNADGSADLRFLRSGGQELKSLKAYLQTLPLKT